MKKLITILLALLGLVAPGWTGSETTAPERPYHGIALIGDPHLPGRNLPIAFFHAPLAGTLMAYNERVDAPGFIAQPAERLRDLLKENPQLFLWVAGHMHVPATNEGYRAPVNLYEGRVTVIHNSDLERKRPWTNVLYLYPERVVVRTYDHWQQSWRPDLERTIRPPMLPALPDRVPVR